VSDPILQSTLRDAPWMAPHTRRLPGIQPADPDDWLRVDEAYSAQMARRETLLKTRPDEVIATCAGSLPAQQELLETVLDSLPALGFIRRGDVVERPDGKRVTLGAPLKTMGHLVQEDFCILEKRGDEHVLSAAVLCFPASWTLAEKIGRPLSAIHIPVTSYAPDIARRVQRMFDAIRPGQVLWRANALFYEDGELFQPRMAGDVRAAPSEQAPFVRSERQCLLRLPRTGAVVFSIHTVVVHHSSLSAQQRAGLAGVHHTGIGDVNQRS